VGSRPQKTASRHWQLCSGQGPDPTTGGEAKGRSGSTLQRVDLGFSKTIHQLGKRLNLLPLFILTQSGNCGNLRGKCILWLKYNGRIARTPRWWATTQRAICNRGRKGGVVGISLYPAMASVASANRGGEGQAYLRGCGNERQTGKRKLGL
jgi:hypothetical protein